MKYTQFVLPNVYSASHAINLLYDFIEAFGSSEVQFYKVSDDFTNMDWNFEEVLHHNSETQFEF